MSGAPFLNDGRMPQGRQIAPATGTLGVLLPGLGSAAEAEAIDVTAVAWLLETEVGKRLRGEKTRVLREWPFVLRTDPRRYDAAALPQDAGDILLVRGTIDCLFDAGNGWEVLDYKTDAVRGPAVGERAAVYAGQLSIYADAVEAAWGAPPARRWLAFLTPREVVGV